MGRLVAYTGCLITLGVAILVLLFVYGGMRPDPAPVFDPCAPASGSTVFPMPQ